MPAQAGSLPLAPPKAPALPWKSFNYINTSKGLNNPTKKLLLSPQNKEIEIFKKCLTATGSLTGFFSSDFRYFQ